MKRSGRDRLGNVPAIALQTPITFEVGPGFVTAVIHFGNSTMGLKFETAEQLLIFFSELIENAAMAWPDDPYIRMYLDE